MKTAARPPGKPVPFALKRLMIGAFGLSSIAAADPGKQALAVDQVLAAERSFAEEADRIGIVPAFRQYVGADAVMFLPRPIIINPRLSTAHWPGDLDWRPEYIAVSSDGGTAVTFGPSAWRVGAEVEHGVYLTIWTRGADGWRFILDRNAPMSQDLYGRPEAPLVRSFSVAAPDGVDGLHEAMAEFDRLAAQDYAAALRQWLAPDGFVLRRDTPPQPGRPAPSGITLPTTFEPEQSGQSQDGDLTWSYGLARWGGAAPGEGYYVRVWQRRADGWRLSIDHLVPLDPAPAA